MQLTGLHHVTAVTGNVSKNIHFYTQVMGLRLVKKTVNQDDVSAYHLYYADNDGDPGTDLTFFDWPHIGRNSAGTGTIGTIAMRVAGPEAIEWWVRHLEENGVTIQSRGEFAGRQGIQFTDPEGMSLALYEDGNAPTNSKPWKKSPIPAEFAIRGLDVATIVVRQIEPLALVLTDVLGFRQSRHYQLSAEEGHQMYVFETGEGGPGTEVHVEARPNGRNGRLGIGGVHHIAFRTPTPEEHQLWRERIAQVGLGVTPVIDRFYFKSIYFRVPGGVLFEIATDGPGFATDEDIEHLGETLALPPFLEAQRAEIEKGLTPIQN
ncbi:ring-cleaving dioxygenase [Tengunoibacter tsumagoiensis]|uniref:Glyoxalase n=1 Tax=Tengunoibacter tsumagoiensis TaxID=2014871 RepID=A0A401ZV27_9CHLR|nr:ring-cleaving dioxygenase [Tengunoibacter tsumagoiensis]GCE10646.1 glyoxalase [Tengunoibacter tsumagoiensis]